MAQVIHGSLRRRLYVVSFLGSVILALALAWQGKDLTKPKPSEACAFNRDFLPPIVAFELAGTATCAQEFVSAWTQQTSDRSGQPLIEIARKQIWLDMPFTFFYPLLFALICGSVAGLWTGWVKRIGGWISWAVIVACPLDLAENIALLKILNGASVEYLPPFAATCAMPKFGLLIEIAFSRTKFKPLAALGLDGVQTGDRMVQQPTQIALVFCQRIKGSRGNSEGNGYSLLSDTGPIYEVAATRLSYHFRAPGCFIF